jgi:hypothetical protein
VKTFVSFTFLVAPKTMTETEELRNNEPTKACSAWNINELAHCLSPFSDSCSPQSQRLSALLMRACERVAHNTLTDWIHFPAQRGTLAPCCDAVPLVDGVIFAEAFLRCRNN